MGDTTTRPTDDTDDTTEPVGDRGHDHGADREHTWPSRGRKIAFRTFSILVALFTLAYFSFGLLEAGFMWLPDQFFLDDPQFGEDYPGGILPHRSHFMAIGLVAWTVVPAVLVQLRKPWRRVAPMLVVVVMGIAGAIAYGLAGTLVAWVSEDLIVTIPFLVLAALHPRAADLLRRPAFDRGMLGWAVLAALPWTVYALAQARLQYLDQPGDIHAGIEHWAAAFMLAVAVMTCAFLGASDHDGWRLPAWTAVAVSVVFGVHSLVFPGLASGLSLVAAVGAIAWGGGYAVALVRRARSASAPAVT